MFPAFKSAAYDLAPEWVLELCKTILEHLGLNAILCDFVHDFGALWELASGTKTWNIRKYNCV